MACPGEWGFACFGVACAVLGVGEVCGYGGVGGVEVVDAGDDESVEADWAGVVFVGACAVADLVLPLVGGVGGALPPEGEGTAGGEGGEVDVFVEGWVYLCVDGVLCEEFCGHGGVIGRLVVGTCGAWVTWGK